MLVWKILAISNIVFNVFASVVLGLAVYRVYKSRKKVRVQSKVIGAKR